MRKQTKAENGAPVAGFRETNEASMIAAHKAGVAYWRNNRADLSLEQLSSVARSCGWYGEDNAAWVAGYVGARRQEQQK